MSVRVARVAVTTVACLVWLAGCETSTKLGDLISKSSDKTAADTSSEPTTAGLPPVGTSPGDATGSISPPGTKSPTDPTVTGSVAFPVIGSKQPTEPGLLGSDPNDDLSLGKRHFRAANFGLAERYFRRAVEFHPRDVEAWVDLAAAYDRLRRFDLADRAYQQALKIEGPRPEILNNYGFSYMLRGDYRKAREKLLAAQASDPNNPHVKANLRLLEDSSRNGKGIE